MAILKGLTSIKRHDEEVERRRAERERKTNWFTLAQDEKVEIIFLQELDESSDRYSEKNGLGFLAQEHNNPSKAEFFKRVVCTNDEEHDFECWGCEKNRLEWSKSTDQNKYNGGWGVKTNLYINALVRRADGTEEVVVLQRKRSDQSFVDDLIDMAGDDGFISNRLFTLARKGTGFKTKYVLTHKDEDAGVDVESYELFDLNNVIREVPYAQQAAALGVNTAPPRKDIVDAASDSDGDDPEDDGDDWL